MSYRKAIFVQKFNDYEKKSVDSMNTCVVRDRHRHARVSIHTTVVESRGGDLPDLLLASARMAIARGHRHAMALVLRNEGSREINDKVHPPVVRAGVIARGSLPLEERASIRNDHNALPSRTDLPFA